MPAASKGKPGRPKGATAPLNEKKYCKYIVEEALKGSLPEAILKCLDGMDDAQRASVLTGLMPYCYPKLQAVEHSGQVDTGASQAMVDQLKGMLKELKEL